GAHCEECLVNHWRRPREHYCVTCNCNAVGSLSLQCDETGQCQCKPGVEGQFCDRCKAGFYEFGANGCKDCQCEVAGSYQNQPLCNAETGACTCKANVEGKQCDRCKPGYFDMSSNNQFGCTPCFCFGHSSICDTAPGYFAVNVSSDLSQGKGKWGAVSQRGPLDVQWAEIDKAAAVSDVDGSPVYFVAPDRFLGDQRAAYNQDLVFTLRVHQDNGRPSVQDVIIVGADGQELAIPIFAQENPNPSTEEQTYRFRIHANSQFQWHPRLNELDFIGVLSNVTALKIRGTYSRGDVGLLSSVHLGSASLAPEDANAAEAQWVESCECLEGFVGQFCESCAPGYRREMKFGGSFNRCVKCDCHGHSDSCDAESGACICEHNTGGDTCNRCARGYYGNALQGTPDDCQKCPCPEDGPCILHSDNDIICTECPLGYSGRRCDMCADGFFGDPQNDKPCKECECSGNIDQNSIGNCDAKTGECKKCVYNTRGFNCEKCAKGFWGDALLDPKGDCQPCSCYAPATVKPSMDYDVLECRQDDGQCECLPHVTGVRCDQCESGYFNLTSGVGCQECNCDTLGSLNTTCNVVTGACQCKPGITGRRCDQCELQHFGFGAEGCKRCDCEVIGSASLKCDVGNGQCQCRTNIVGRRCDKCIENMYDIQRGCLKCDECYTLIQRRVNDYRKEIADLKDVLTEIIENPVQVNDTDFDNRLAEVIKKVEELADLVSEKLAGDDSALVGQVSQLKKDLAEASKLVKTVDETIQKAGQTATATDEVLARWNAVKDRAFNDLDRAQKYLETEGKTQWELATEAAAKYGEQSQQLSEIAQEARKLADKHENRSLEIAKLADTAFNASKEALDDAKEAIFGGESTSQQIEKLKSQLTAAEDVYNQTAQLAAEQLEAAAAANKEAAETLTTVEGLQLPDVDAGKLSADAKKIQEDAKSAQEMAQTEAANNKQVIDDSARATQDANYQLQRAVASQQEVDAMLAEVDAAKAKALEAVALAENTLKEANETLYTLIDFNQLVE
uniref:Uncharacterized protein n=1 Tax=Plectus sambesii TaxID=2011161 RepID=A0A914X951_9BILA